MNENAERFIYARLYAITDLRAWSDDVACDIEAACSGGADVIQLRSKVLSPSVLIKAGHVIREITRGWHVLFIVNDDPKLARDLDADGVHLGQDDMSIEEARGVLGNREKLIGKSTHSVDEALRAEAEDADYIGMGPVFRTPTKPDYEAIGLKGLSAIAKRVHKPSVAIGGIDPERIRPVLEAGAKRVAVVRAVFGAEDVYRATRELKDLVLTHADRLEHIRVK